MGAFSGQLVEPAAGFRFMGASGAEGYVRARQRPRRAGTGDKIAGATGSWRNVSRFLCPCGRQSFVWAGHYCPALAAYPEVERDGPSLLPYLALLRVGFALPVKLLPPRCALTAPFHPYLGRCCATRRYIFCGTFRIRFRTPAVSRHAALRRPDFPPPDAFAPGSDCPSASFYINCLITSP
jgi:hypothetical protein